MLKLMRYFLVGLMVSGAVFTAGCEGLGTDNQSEAGYDSADLLVTVEQQNADGKWVSVPVRDHSVKLARRPFRFVFFFDQLGTMYVSASQSSKKAGFARAGYSFARLFPQSKYASSEFQNPSREALVSSSGRFENWLLGAGEMHRFDPGSVRSWKKRGYFCVRTIEQLSVDGSPEAIADFTGNQLYFVFGQTDHRSGQRIETKRDWLRIVFK